MLASSFKGKRVLVTGHNGFKGSWLTAWLTSVGAEVFGLSLAPESYPNHWQCLALNIKEYKVDVRAAEAVKAVVGEVKPEIVFHLAAQAYVRRSYADPLTNWQTNVIGTVNVLEACRFQSCLSAIIVVTTDKCYENKEWHWGYRETDRLGGHDPYSASKAAAEIAVASYRSSFFYKDDSPLLATARAGNVVGGGDWSEDRLIPDIIRAIEAKETLHVRSPYATRPWQHVLDAISGYLLLGEQLLERKQDFARAWNFGPERSSNRSVLDILECFECYWPDLSWELDKGSTPHEAGLLYLDSADALEILKWRPILDFSETMRLSADWYKAWHDDSNVISMQQLSYYQQKAKS